VGCEDVAFVRFVSEARRRQVGRGVRGASRRRRSAQREVGTRASASGLRARRDFYVWIFVCVCGLCLCVFVCPGTGGDGRS
jgi:hypothetical protein